MAPGRIRDDGQAHARLPGLISVVPFFAGGPARMIDYRFDPVLEADPKAAGRQKLNLKSWPDNGR